MLYIIIFLAAVTLFHLIGFLICCVSCRRNSDNWLLGLIICCTILAFLLLCLGLCRFYTWSNLKDLAIEYEYLSLKAEQIAANPNYFAQETFFQEVDNFNRALLRYNERASRWFNWKLYPDASNLSLILVDYS